MEPLKQQIRNLPGKPGIYKYFDQNNDILYIGKAKNLKKRVSSYFSKTASVSGRIKLLVSRISRIEYTIVASESEALLLENSLIKKYQPRYNVMLKDGKTYPLIVIKNESFPRVLSTRRIIRDKSEYFGPFSSGVQKNYLLEMLQRQFRVRTCNLHLSEENIKAGKFKVCLNYHINICKAPCVGYQTKEDYDKNIGRIREILKGKTHQVIEYLKEEMADASGNLEFEKAEELKQTIEALENYQSRSTVVNPRLNNLDVFSFYAKEELAIVNFLRVRNGSVTQTDTLELKRQLEEKKTEMLASAIEEFRVRTNTLSKELIVPFEPDFKYDNINYVIPKIGDKKKLLDLSLKNAMYYHRDMVKRKQEMAEKKDKPRKILEQLKQDLNMDTLPRYIECFDNSNIQGAYPVASLSVFRNGKPDKSMYRHFNIKTVEGPDDYASMEEVVYRRYRRLINENKPLPDLIVIDGGKGQLNSAFKSLAKLGLENKIRIIGIAKKLEEIFVPGDQYPLGIDKKSPSNRLIQQLRNEAHRFGITHHRTRRMRGSLKTGLQEIPGIGIKTAEKILRYFGSVKQINNDNLELEKLIGPHKANLVMNYLENMQED